LPRISLLAPNEPAVKAIGIRRANGTTNRTKLAQAMEFGYWQIVQKCRILFKHSSHCSTNVSA
jgi:hypothetical protein